MNYRIVSTDFNASYRTWLLRGILALGISFMAACNEKPSQPVTPDTRLNPQSEEIYRSLNLAYIAMVEEAQTPAAQQEVQDGLKKLNFAANDVVGNVVSVFVGDPLRVVVIYPGIHSEAAIQKARLATIAKLLELKKIDRVLFEGVSFEYVFKVTQLNEINLEDYVSMIVSEPLNLKNNPRELGRLGQRYPGVPLVYWLSIYDASLVRGVDVLSQLREQAVQQNNFDFIVRKRDQVMADNVEKIMNSGAQNVVLPVGSMHAAGLTKLFRGKNISYVVISHPQVLQTLIKLNQGGVAQIDNAEFLRMLEGVTKDIKRIFTELHKVPLSSPKPIFKRMGDMEQGLFMGAVKQHVAEHKISVDYVFALVHRHHIPRLEEFLQAKHQQFFNDGSNSLKFQAYQTVLEDARQNHPRAHAYLMYLAAREKKDTAEIQKWKKVYIEGYRKFFKGIMR
jgi:hypothetical protein